MLRMCLIVISMFFALPVFAETASNNSSAANNSVTSQFGMSFEQLKQAAAKGDADAEYALGYIYYYGKEGAPQDPNAAKMWIQKAADQGQPQAAKALQLLTQAQTSEVAPNNNNNQVATAAETTAALANSAAVTPANADASASMNNNSSNAASATVNAMANNLAAANQAAANSAASAANASPAAAANNAATAQPQTATSAATNAEVAITPTVTMTNTQQENSSMNASVHEQHKATASKEMSKQQSLTAESLLHAPSHYYTVQLYGAFHQHDATQFIHAHRLHDTATYYQTTFDNKPWFVVVYGIYKTDAEAKAAIKALPANMQALKPWIKPMAEVQEGIRNKATG